MEPLQVLAQEIRENTFAIRDLVSAIREATQYRRERDTPPSWDYSEGTTGTPMPPPPSGIPPWEQTAAGK